MTLKWKQIGNDYELRCPLCTERIATIIKVNGKFECTIIRDGKLMISDRWKTFQSARKAVNARLEEIFNN